MRQAALSVSSVICKRRAVTLPNITNSAGEYHPTDYLSSQVFLRSIVETWGTTADDTMDGTSGADAMRFGKGYAVVRVGGAESRIVLEGVDASLIGQDDFIF